MAYRRYYRQAKPKPRTIEVKYAGTCASCGAPIAVGEMATYYPLGYAGKYGSGHPAITHVGASDGNSIRCFAWTMKPDSPTYFWKREDLEKLRASMQANVVVDKAYGPGAGVLNLAKSLEVDRSVNDYAGDGLDQRYEDDCKERCGL